LLVGANALPYPRQPEAINLGNFYIIVEAILFLLLVIFMFIRFIRLLKDWSSWYTALSLFVFAVFQLAVCVAFESQTIFGTSDAFGMLLSMIGYAGLPILVVNLIGLLRVCFEKPGSNSVIASASLVTCSLFLTALSGVVGFYRHMWLINGEWTQIWIATWSTVFFCLAWVAPIRFLRAHSKSNHGDAKAAGGIIRLSTRTVTFIITEIQVASAILVMQLAAI
jgi:hypothetical protein